MPQQEEYRRDKKANALPKKKLGKLHLQGAKVRLRNKHRPELWRKCLDCSAVVVVAGVCGGKGISRE